MFLFFARLTQYTFLSKKTEYFNTVTHPELLFMPLKGNVLLETQIFLVVFFEFVFVCFESSQENKKPEMYFISEVSFLLDDTHTASATSILGR